MKSFLLYLSLLSITTAQVLSPPQSPPPPKDGGLFGVNNASNAQSGTDANQPSAQNNQNNFGSTSFSFGDEIPILNPSSETITIGGLTLPIGDNRLIKARFEKYLNQPAEDIEAAKQYHQVLDKIVELLAPRPGQPARNTKIEEAFTLLPEAAAFPGDAKICQSLAETVYASLQAKQDIRQLAALNTALDERRKKLAVQADWIKSSESSTPLASRPTSGGGEESSSKQNKRTEKVDSLTSQKYLGIIKEIGEIEANRKKHVIQGERQVLQTKIQFQASMMQWLAQRRFHHVVIAARFYNVIWEDGDNALHIKKDANLSKLFTRQLGFSPTVTAVDSVANEAIRDTQNSIDACIHMMDSGDLHTASKRLLEAFAIGEYLTPVSTFELQRKQKMQTYIRDLSMLFDAAQARDWGRARELTVKLKGDAKDFPSSKAESAISANILASNMQISKAQKALIDENEAIVAEAISSATEYWPTNPKLAEFSNMLDQGSTVSVLRKDFQRLINEQNYREIYKRQYEFFPVLSNTPNELAQLQEIIQNIGKIEIAIEKANSFSKAGNSYAAWEQLAILREDFPEDPKLGRQLELLAPEVADFTKALKTAKDLASRTPQQTGSAISHFLKARSIYPNSDFATEGLNNLIDETLGE